MASPPPRQVSRPVTLKLKTPGFASRAPSITAAPIVATPSAMSPPPATPSAGGHKIILKRSQPPTPAVVPDGVPIFSPIAPNPAPSTAATASTPTVTMTQKGRVSRPTAKKRAREYDDSEDDAKPHLSTGPPKRPKLVLKKTLKPKTASIVLKHAPKELPPHSKGEGYDSEDEDREIDPIIEEEFIMRMLPGEHCEYLRRMIEERKIGAPAKDDRADFQMRWLPGAERRALLTINGTHFVGVLVDLPTITESMKTWDRRNFMKAADISQMLLVFATVADDAEAKSIPLPTMVTKDYRWPHGLTPPMHDCTHRRFRKRLSKKEIKDKEAELQRLLNEDRIALETKWELIDDGRDATTTTATAGAGGAAGAEYGEMEDGEEDAYGEVDEEYFGQAPGPAAEIDDAELEAMFMEEEVDDDDDAAAASAETPATQTAGTPAAGKPETPAAESDASDEDEDDDDDDMDEDQQAQAEQVKGVREDINELKKQLQVLDKNLAATQNMLLRKRIEENKKRVLSELRLKQASIGEVDEEE